MPCRRLDIMALAVSAILAACNTVSLWSVGEAPGPPDVTGTIVLYIDAAYVSACEGSNQAKLHPQCSACS